MSLKRFLTRIEYKLDLLNPEYGSLNELCIYCKSKEYNAKVGIIHKEDCPIYELRLIIKAIPYWFDIEDFIKLE